MYKTVYVTGCLGFIGYHVAKSCLEKGWYVCGIDKGTYAANWNLLDDLLSYKNEDSVKRSIRNILLTDKGERFFNPTFGSDIRKMLFENFSPSTEQVVADLIKTAIGNHEPRANVIDVNVSGNPDQNSMYINIVFSVINKAEPVTLELILNRIR